MVNVILFLVTRNNNSMIFPAELFLSNDDKEKLHDFEEECVEDYFRFKEHKFQSSSEERIRNINER